jgi:hypothetical protein
LGLVDQMNKLIFFNLILIFHLIFKPIKQCEVMIGVVEKNELAEVVGLLFFISNKSFIKENVRRP